MFLGSLLTANASPTKGFRIGICAGVASSCQGAQARLSYNHDRFGITLGAGLIAQLSATGQVYFSTGEQKIRQFASLSYAAVAFPLIAVQFDGNIDGSLGGSAGISYGADFHFLKNQKLILTPRIGVDYSSWINENGGDSAVHPSLSTELTLAF